MGLLWVIVGDSRKKTLVSQAEAGRVAVSHCPSCPAQLTELEFWAPEESLPDSARPRGRTGLVGFHQLEEPPGFWDPWDSLPRRM